MARRAVLTVDDDGLREAASLSAAGTSAGLIGVAFSPDGTRLMTGDTAIAEVNVWDVTAIGGGEWVNAEAVPEKAADFSPDSRGVVIGSDDAVSILDVESALPTITIESDSPLDAGLLDMSPDGHLIAASNWDPAVHVFDAATGDQAFTIDGTGYGWASDLGWSGDSQLLAVSFELPVRSEVVIVDRSGTTVGTIHAAPGFGFDSVDLSPNGALALVASSRLDTQDTPTKVEIWDWKSGEIVQTVETSATRAAFDPTGERIATNVQHQGSVAIWDAQTGTRLAESSAPTQTTDLAFSPDGTTIATTHADGTVRVWDAVSGIQRLVLPGHNGPAWAVAFSPDGSMLASSGGDGIVRVWALATDDLIAIAEDRLTRGFTDDECRQYLHLERCPAA